MIYKFDILFKKVLANGGVKVVTYSQLLENPNAFGEKETLEGAIGELSVVKEGLKKGYSINSLLLRYHSQMIGRANAEIWVRDFPLIFSFNEFNEISSIKTELKDESGYLYLPKIETMKIVGDVEMDLCDTDSFLICVVYDGELMIGDKRDNSLKVQKGEAVFMQASTDSVILSATSSIVKLITNK